MSKPTKEQLDQALAAAERLRDLNQDDEHLGCSLLYLESRNQVLERLFDAAKHYLNSGEEQHAHARLMKAVDAVRHHAHENTTSLDRGSAFGLE